MGCFVYVLLGTSKDITIGPTAILSQIVASSIDTQHQVIIPLMTLMCGISQFALGFLELGGIVNFISLPIITGFTSAAAISIAAGQLKHLLGFPKQIKIGRDFLPCIKGTFKYIRHSNVWDIVIGVSCVILVMALRYLKTHVQSWNDSDRHKSRRQIVARKFLWFIATGRNALVVVVAALIGGVLVSQNLGDKIKLVKNVKEGLPPIINPMATSNYSFKDAMSVCFIHIL
jgi:sodium-independent sulfate anion transporter 11